LFASICGYFVGLLVSFLFAKLWVFQDKSKRSIIKSFSLFCLIYLFGGLEMSLVIYFLNQLFNNYKIAWFVGAFIGSMNNYLGSKYISFRK
jgi:putative flippase GtrA